MPDLLLHDSTEQHVKSIDVDLALDAAKLTDGRYAELLALLLDTRRYERSEKPFQLFANVDLGDGQRSVRVDVDFLSPIEFKLRSRRSKKIEGFRVQQADGCSAAFRAPEAIIVEGWMVNGALNSVELRVAALPDFLVMKCYALRGRDKPKDAYDICFCLDQVADGGAAIAAIWRARMQDKDIAVGLDVLRTKFRTTDDYGPRQVVEFHQSTDAAERGIQARRFPIGAAVSGTGRRLKKPGVGREKRRNREASEDCFVAAFLAYPFRNSPRVAVSFVEYACRVAGRGRRATHGVQ